MIGGILIAAAMTIQVQGVDGVQARRIHEASKAADCWIFYKVHLKLVPDETIVRTSGRRRVELERMQVEAIRDLTDATYGQLCKDYGVTRAQFDAVLRNPAWASSFDHEYEFKKLRLFRRRPAPWETSRTRFSPHRVHMPEGLARKYGFVNPRPRVEPSPDPVRSIERLVADSPLAVNLKDALGTGIATAGSTGRR